MSVGSSFFRFYVIKVYSFAVPLLLRSYCPSDDVVMLATQISDADPAPDREDHTHRKGLPDFSVSGYWKVLEIFRAHTMLNCAH